jgi:hypothetical protein
MAHQVVRRDGLFIHALYLKPGQIRRDWSVDIKGSSLILLHHSQARESLCDRADFKARFCCHRHSGSDISVSIVGSMQQLVAICQRKRQPTNGRFLHELTNILINTCDNFL